MGPYGCTFAHAAVYASLMSKRIRVLSCLTQFSSADSNTKHAYSSLRCTKRCICIWDTAAHAMLMTSPAMRAHPAPSFESVTRNVSREALRCHSKLDQAARQVAQIYMSITKLWPGYIHVQHPMMMSSGLMTCDNAIQTCAPCPRSLCKYPFLIFCRSLYAYGDFAMSGTSYPPAPIVLSITIHQVLNWHRE